MKFPLNLKKTNKVYSILDLKLQDEQNVLSENIENLKKYKNYVENNLKV